MTKPFSLQPLMNLAQHQNESATRELGQLNKQQHDAQGKLEMLLQYRSEYQARLQKSTLSGINPAELRNFQQFINKLDAAIAQQIKVLEQGKVSLQAGRGEFNNTQRKLKSFSTLQEHHFEEQKKVATKSEQRVLDEHNGRFVAIRMQEAEDQNH
ncbi:MAG: Flagellar export protein FliJ [Candidatus Gallionella acididurans]|uniref:Flagellar FliJ protein n=1 Tax=Candidatus Gallionella acididurans TaxID=1796491 RepID=A0A139BXM6_9PROT|nr:MAG: Flagellar export protein FliJ [Candidatus Gallionella acididurans]